MDLIIDRRCGGSQRPLVVQGDPGFLTYEPPCVALCMDGCCYSSSLELKGALLHESLEWRLIALAYLLSGALGSLAPDLWGTCSAAADGRAAGKLRGPG